MQKESSIEDVVKSHVIKMTHVLKNSENGK